MTSSADAPELVVRYEGVGSGADEIWGGTQANFLAFGGHLPAGKEVAVMLNDPAAAMLAETLGIENTPEFRAEAARRVGEAAIRGLHDRTRHLDPVITVSRATLETYPDLVNALRP